MGAVGPHEFASPDEGRERRKGSNQWEQVCSKGTAACVHWRDGEDFAIVSLAEDLIAVETL